MMMKRITEQISDVSRGNTAALFGIDQFVLKKKDLHSENS